MIEILIYSDYAKGVESVVVDSIAKARMLVKKLWDAEIDLPPAEEDDFATAPIVMEICGNHKEIGLVQQSGYRRAVTDKIAWTEFNRGDESAMRHSEPKQMTRDEVMAAVAEWYDAIGTHLNDFDGIQFTRVKE